MDDVKKYRADWRHVVLTTEDDAQYVGIADYSSKCSAADVYYRAWKSTEEEMDAQRLRADTAEAELKREREFNAVNVSEAERMLAATEQRIAELSADNQQLRKLLEQTLAALNPTAKLSKSIRAALNPNPEAGSQ